MSISTIYLTLVLVRCVSLTPRLDLFTPAKENRYPSYMRLSGPRDRSGRVRKSRFLLAFNSRTISPWRVAIQTTLCTWCVKKVMTLNAWLDNWQCCSHTSDTSRDLHSYLMISASFNSIALTRLI